VGWEKERGKNLVFSALENHLDEKETQKRKTKEVWDGDRFGNTRTSFQKKNSMKKRKEKKKAKELTNRNERIPTHCLENWTTSGDDQSRVGLRRKLEKIWGGFRERVYLRKVP